MGLKTAAALFSLNKDRPAKPGKQKEPTMETQDSRLTIRASLIATLAATIYTTERDRVFPDETSHTEESAIERAKEPEAADGERYTVERREGKRFKAWLVHNCHGLRSGIAKFRSVAEAEKAAEALNIAKGVSDGE